MNMHFQTAVETDNPEDLNLPKAVKFSIDEALAKEIVKLANLVQQGDLYKVEKFDYTARYVAEYTNINHTITGDILITTQADCLNVSKKDFWFSAVLRFTGTVVRSQRKRISELEEFFGLPKSTDCTDHASAESTFVADLARMSIWDYDNDDGPYDECEEPTDGHVDSHCTLMQLIEAARELSPQP